MQATSIYINFKTKILVARMKKYFGDFSLNTKDRQKKSQAEESACSCMQTKNKEIVFCYQNCF